MAPRRAEIHGCPKELRETAGQTAKVDEGRRRLSQTREAAKKPLAGEFWAMARRSPSQKIGSRGQRFAMSLIEDHSEWLARDLTEDFGVDAEAELTNTGINGDILKLQFKASERVRQKGNNVEFRIARKYLEYARSCRYPVIFVRISLADRQAWYLWLQDWLLWQRASGNEPDESVTVWIAQSQTLASGLDSSLRDVARWRGETQLALSLIDAMRAATAIFDPELTSQLVLLISKAGPIIGDLASSEASGRRAKT
jgi:hypothetical protein